MATRIVGIDGMTYAELDEGLRDGGRFVYYTYVISIIVMTFRRSTNIYYVPPGQSRIAKGLPWTILSLLLGWWGIPWGPIYTFGTLGTNLSGGKDVTMEVEADLFHHPADAVAPSTHDGEVETGYTPPQPA